MERARKVIKIFFIIGELLAVVAGALFWLNGEYILGTLAIILVFVVTIMEDVLDIYRKLLDFYKLSEMQTDCIKQMSLNHLGLSSTLDKYIKALEKKDKEIEKLKKEVKKLGDK